MNATPSWLAIEGGRFYVARLDDEPVDEDERAAWRRSRQLLTAFVRRSFRAIARHAGMSRGVPATPSSADNLLPEINIAALVDFFRVLQSWDDETRR